MTQPNTKNNKTCFVIMPFSEAFDEVFEYAITPAVESRGFQCIRMDEVVGAINIIHGIIENIFKADLIIADLTGKNANVYYELGVAHSAARSNNTIMIAEEDEDIPFDIAPYKVLKYTRSYKGINKLQKDIAAIINSFESGSLTTNPVQDFRIQQKTQSQQHDLPATSRAQPAEMIFNQLNMSLVRISILSLLNDLPNNSPGLRIGDITQKLSLQKRKITFIALTEMESDELIIKNKIDKSAFWKISSFGREMLQKLSEGIAIKIETVSSS